MDTVRAFISLDIPFTDALSGLIRDIKRNRDLRPSPIHQIHITLAFLGDTDRKLLSKVCDSLESELNGFGPFDLVSKGVGAFPDLRNPRVVWIGIEDSKRLTELASTVRKVLDGLGADYDKKRFSPHITVARVNRRTDVTDLAERYGDAEFCSFTCDSVNVMTSVLSPEGAKHTAERKIRL